MSTLTKNKPDTHQDTFPINGTDYIEFYVGNAKHTAHYYQTAFGFKLVAYRSTGDRQPRYGFLRPAAGKIRFVLTAALSPDHEISQHVLKHGDGVKVLALWVDDARDAFKIAVERGAKAAMEPKTLKDEVRRSDGCLHPYLRRNPPYLCGTQALRRNFMPGFRAKRA